MAANQVTLMERLHEEHAAALWGYCLHLTGGDRARAEDLVQETLLRACRRFSTREVGQGSVRAWLFTVARNLRIDEWRSRRSHVEYAVAEPPETADPSTTPTSCCSRGWSPRRSAGSPTTTGRCCGSATTGAARWPRRLAGSTSRRAR